ncbi:SRPBCC family protein [Luteipulveratus flavus]|uniref:SRPBCC family protein n=1 Tax=Luteipulveratus flavus TaxID=3031728 RepID=A0ABT6CCY4_9MICO|nr:SRPBCC family protein [Luteipulveratus sp. YIM 133296]MDF8266142.1 SRPBCC family protein [Luteipulveratus sp. YIM 133296]
MSTQTRTLATMHLWAGVPGVRLEDTYATDIDDLWEAVTDPERLARWVAHVTGDLRPGGRFEIRFTSGAEGPGRIEACEPPHRLFVTMMPGEDDATTLEATLAEVDGGTRLVVEERGLPREMLPAYGGGWQVHLEDLHAYLEGRPTADWGARANELKPTYQAMSVEES